LLCHGVILQQCCDEEGDAGSGAHCEAPIMGG
jgi:hypothetical protein